jgi:hypothetical protein
MTLEEAKLKAEADNKSAIRPFCPLIDDQCQTGCICWQEAEAYEMQVSLDGGTHKGQGQYEVRWMGCTNQMFFRECNHSY